MSVHIHVIETVKSWLMAKHVFCESKVILTFHLQPSNSVHPKFMPNLNEKSFFYWLQLLLAQRHKKEGLTWCSTAVQCTRFKRKFGDFLIFAMQRKNDVWFAHPFSWQDVAHHPPATFTKPWFKCIFSLQSHNHTLTKARLLFWIQLNFKWTPLGSQRLTKLLWL